jgi:uncharacterized protein (DUF1778 family)
MDQRQILRPSAVGKSQREKAYRFDARLNEEQKTLIQRAADLEGRMTDFVLHSAETAAERTIRDRAMLMLTARQTELFVSRILRPAEPGRVVRAGVGKIRRRSRLLA